MSKGVVAAIQGDSGKEGSRDCEMFDNEDELELHLFEGNCVNGE